MDMYLRFNIFITNVPWKIGKIVAAAKLSLAEKKRRTEKKIPSPNNAIQLVQLLNDGKMLVNDGEMLFNDGEKSIR